MPIKSKSSRTLVDDFVVCPHIHFNCKPVDRSGLSRSEHLNLLATPKGYRWDLQRNSASDPGVGNKRGKHVKYCREPRSPPPPAYSAQFLNNFIAEVWATMNPKTLQKLRRLMMEEFGMTENEAEEFIEQQRDQHISRSSNVFPSHENSNCNCGCQHPSGYRITRVSECTTRPKHNLGPRHDSITKLVDIISKKVSNILVFAMGTKRNKRQRYMAEAVLADLCRLTGEQCTLTSPQTRVQKTLVVTADRIAVWLEDLTKERKQYGRHRPDAGTFRGWLQNQYEEIEKEKKQLESEKSNQKKHDDDRSGGEESGGGGSDGGGSDGEGHGGAGRGGAGRGRGGRGGAGRGGGGRGGAERGGAERGGAERGGAERGGAERGGAESGGADRGGAERGGAERGGAERGGAERGGGGRGGAESDDRESYGGGSDGGGSDGQGHGGAGHGGVGRGGGGRGGAGRGVTESDDGGSYGGGRGGGGRGGGGRGGGGRGGAGREGSGRGGAERGGAEHGGAERGSAESDDVGSYGGGSDGEGHGGAGRGGGGRGGAGRGGAGRGGAGRGGAERGGTERGGAERGGGGSGGAKRGGAERGGTEHGAAERGGAERDGAERGGGGRGGAGKGREKDDYGSKGELDDEGYGSKEDGLRRPYKTGDKRERVKIGTHRTPQDRSLDDFDQQKKSRPEKISKNDDIQGRKRGHEVDFNVADSEAAYDVNVAEEGKTVKGQDDTTLKKTSSKPTGPPFSAKDASQPVGDSETEPLLSDQQESVNLGAWNDVGRAISIISLSAELGDKPVVYNLKKEKDGSFVITVLPDVKKSSISSQKSPHAASAHDVEQKQGAKSLEEKKMQPVDVQSEGVTGAALPGSDSQKLATDKYKVGMEDQPGRIKSKLGDEQKQAAETLGEQEKQVVDLQSAGVPSAEHPSSDIQRLTTDQAGMYDPLGRRMSKLDNEQSQGAEMVGEKKSQPIDIQSAGVASVAHPSSDVQRPAKEQGDMEPELIKSKLDGAQQQPQESLEEDKKQPVDFQSAGVTGVGYPSSDTQRLAGDKVGMDDGPGLITSKFDDEQKQAGEFLGETQSQPADYQSTGAATAGHAISDTQRPAADQAGMDDQPGRRKSVLDYEQKQGAESLGEKKAQPIDSESAGATSATRRSFDVQGLATEQAGVDGQHEIIKSKSSDQQKQASESLEERKTQPVDFQSDGVTSAAHRSSDTQRLALGQAGMDDQPGRRQSKLDDEQNQGGGSLGEKKTQPIDLESAGVAGVVHPSSDTQRSATEKSGVGVQKDKPKSTGELAKPGGISEDTEYLQPSEVMDSEALSPGSRATPKKTTGSKPSVDLDEQPGTTIPKEGQLDKSEPRSKSEAKSAGEPVGSTGAPQESSQPSKGADSEALSPTVRASPKKTIGSKGSAEMDEQPGTVKSKEGTLAKSDRRSQSEVNSAGEPIKAAGIPEGSRGHSQHSKAADLVSLSSASRAIPKETIGRDRSKTSADNDEQPRRVSKESSMHRSQQRFKTDASDTEGQVRSTRIPEEGTEYLQPSKAAGPGTSSSARTTPDKIGIPISEATADMDKQLGPVSSKEDQLGKSDHRSRSEPKSVGEREKSAGVREGSMEYSPSSKAVGLETLPASGTAPKSAIEGTTLEARAGIDDELGLRRSKERQLSKSEQRLGSEQRSVGEREKSAGIREGSMRYSPSSKAAGQETLSATGTAPKSAIEGTTSEEKSAGIREGSMRYSPSSKAAGQETLSATGTAPKSAIEGTTSEARAGIDDELGLRRSKEGLLSKSEQRLGSEQRSVGEREKSAGIREGSMRYSPSSKAAGQETLSATGTAPKSAIEGTTSEARAGIDEELGLRRSKEGLLSKSEQRLRSEQRSVGEREKSAGIREGSMGYSPSSKPVGLETIPGSGNLEARGGIDEDLGLRRSKEGELIKSEQRLRSEQRSVGEREKSAGIREGSMGYSPSSKPVGLETMPGSGNLEARGGIDEELGLRRSREGLLNESEQRLRSEQRSVGEREKSAGIREGSMGYSPSSKPVGLETMPVSGNLEARGGIDEELGLRRSKEGLLSKSEHRLRSEQRSVGEREKSAGIPDGSMGYSPSSKPVGLETRPGPGTLESRAGIDDELGLRRSKEGLLSKSEQRLRSEQRSVGEREKSAGIREGSMGYSPSSKPVGLETLPASGTTPKSTIGGATLEARAGIDDELGLQRSKEGLLNKSEQRLRSEQRSVGEREKSAGVREGSMGYSPSSKPVGLETLPASGTTPKSTIGGTTPEGRAGIDDELGRLRSKEGLLSRSEQRLRSEQRSAGEPGKSAGVPETFSASGTTPKSTPGGTGLEPRAGIDDQPVFSKSNEGLLNTSQTRLDVEPQSATQPVKLTPMPKGGTGYSVPVQPTQSEMLLDASGAGLKQVIEKAISEASANMDDRLKDARSQEGFYTNRGSLQKTIDKAISEASSNVDFKRSKEGTVSTGSGNRSKVSDSGGKPVKGSELPEKSTGPSRPPKPTDSEALFSASAESLKKAIGKAISEVSSQAKLFDNKSPLKDYDMRGVEKAMLSTPSTGKTQADLSSTSTHDMMKKPGQPITRTGVSGAQPKSTTGKSELYQSTHTSQPSPVSHQTGATYVKRQKPSSEKVLATTLPTEEGYAISMPDRMGTVEISQDQKTMSCSPDKTTRFAKPTRTHSKSEEVIFSISHTAKSPSPFLVTGMRKSKTGSIEPFNQKTSLKTTSGTSMHANVATSTLDHGIAPSSIASKVGRESDGSPRKFSSFTQDRKSKYPGKAGETHKASPDSNKGTPKLDNLITNSSSLGTIRISIGRALSDNAFQAKLVPSHPEATTLPTSDYQQDIIGKTKPTTTDNRSEVRSVVSVHDEQNYHPGEYTSTGAHTVGRRSSQCEVKGYPQEKESHPNLQTEQGRHLEFRDSDGPRVDSHHKTARVGGDSSEPMEYPSKDGRRGSSERFVSPSGIGTDNISLKNIVFKVSRNDSFDNLGFKPVHIVQRSRGWETGFEVVKIPSELDNSAERRRSRLSPPGEASEVSPVFQVIPLDDDEEQKKSVS